MVKELEQTAASVAIFLWLLQLLLYYNFLLMLLRAGFGLRF